MYILNMNMLLTAVFSFSGKMITAAYVPVMSYHSLFPEAMNATQLIYPR